AGKVLSTGHWSMKQNCTRNQEIFQPPLCRRRPPPPAATASGGGRRRYATRRRSLPRDAIFCEPAATFGIERSIALAFHASGLRLLISRRTVFECKGNIRDSISPNRVGNGHRTR